LRRFRKTVSVGVEGSRLFEKLLRRTMRITRRLSVWALLTIRFFKK